MAPSFAERLAALPSLYTAAAVAAHSEVDALRYFELPAAALASLPLWLQAALHEELSMGGPYLQVLPDYVALINRLSALSTPRGRFHLRKPLAVTGGSGMGKTALLAYLHLWAQDSGWLVLAVQAQQLMTDKLGWIEPQPGRTDVLQQPRFTAQWLHELDRLQGDRLSRLRLKQRYPHAPHASNLQQLVQQGAADAALAVSVRPRTATAQPLSARVSRTHRL